MYLCLNINYQEINFCNTDSNVSIYIYALHSAQYIGCPSHTHKHTHTHTHTHTHANTHTYFFLLPVPFPSFRNFKLRVIDGLFCCVGV